MGFWNAVIGLWLLHGAQDGLTPLRCLEAGETDAPLKGARRS